MAANAAHARDPEVQTQWQLAAASAAARQLRASVALFAMSAAFRGPGCVSADECGLARPRHGRNCGGVKGWLRPMPQGEAIGDNLDAPFVNDRDINVPVSHAGVPGDACSLAAGSRKGPLQWQRWGGKHARGGAGSLGPAAFPSIQGYCPTETGGHLQDPGPQRAQRADQTPEQQQFVRSVPQAGRIRGSTRLLSVGVQPCSCLGFAPLDSTRFCKLLLQKC